jgi:hypothetical protein
MAMAFVVKFIGLTGKAFWLSAPNAQGIRTFTLRKRADVFPAIEDAHVAIAKMPRAFEHAGLIFSVESAD